MSNKEGEKNSTKLIKNKNTKQNTRIPARLIQRYNAVRWI